MPITINESIYSNNVVKKRKLSRSCKLCHEDQNQFVYDEIHDDTICTNCGCVQDKYFNPVTYEVFKEQPRIPWVDQETKEKIKVGKRMIKNVDKEGVKECKFYITLNRLCDVLDVKENVKSKTEAIFKNFKQLMKIKPMESVIAAVIVIAQKECGLYVNTKHVSKILNIKKLNKIINKISSNILEIDNYNYTLASLPRYIFLMRMEFKEEKRLRQMFEVASKQNVSMGSDTIIALCLYIRMKQLKLDKKHSELNLEYIANLTNTSLISLQGYISGKTKCSFIKKK